MWWQPPVRFWILEFVSGGLVFAYTSHFQDKRKAYTYTSYTRHSSGLPLSHRSHLKKNENGETHARISWIGNYCCCQFCHRLSGKNGRCYGPAFQWSELNASCKPIASCDDTLPGVRQVIADPANPWTHECFISISCMHRIKKEIGRRKTPVFKCDLSCAIRAFPKTGQHPSECAVGAPYCWPLGQRCFSPSTASILLIFFLYLLEHRWPVAPSAHSLGRRPVLQKARMAQFRSRTPSQNREHFPSSYHSLFYVVHGTRRQAPFHRKRGQIWKKAGG